MTETLVAGLRLQEYLIDLEFLMRDSGLWQEKSPPDEAFASELPFCHDRMNFSEWLQFVFIPSLWSLAQGQDSWPADCAVAPMADYYFDAQELTAERLIAQLKRIDDLVSAHENSGETPPPSQTK